MIYKSGMLFRYGQASTGRFGDALATSVRTDVGFWHPCLDNGEYSLS